MSKQFHFYKIVAVSTVLTGERSEGLLIILQILGIHIEIFFLK